MMFINWFLFFALSQSSLAQSTTSTTLLTQELVCGTQVEMGTEFRICIVADKDKQMAVAQDVQREFRTLGEVNEWMSDWIEDTALNKIVTAAGIRPVKVPKELFELLQFSQTVSEKSKGAYDPTFNVFFGLYNFKKGQEREPTDEEIKERLSLINYKDLVLDPKEQTAFLKRSGMKLGLGAIGQGYAVDKLVQNLKTKKFLAGYVDGSGDTYFWGKKPDGSLWNAGLRNPLNKEKPLLKIYGTNFSVTTSGDDEKFFMVGDRRVHHIIDPKTGHPTKGLRQVTIVSRTTALMADAYDTTCMVLGAKECLKLLKSEKLDGVLVLPDGKVEITKGLIKKKDKWGEYYSLKD